MLQVKPGPWGKIEYSYVYLEAPEYLLKHVAVPNTVPRWSFIGGSEASVKALLSRAGVPPVLAATILTHVPKTQTNPRAFILFPQVSELEVLSAESRRVIYAELAKNPENEFHADPVMIAGSVDEWLDDTGLRAELKSKIRTFCYPRGSVMALSDVRSILSFAESDEEMRHIVRTFSRTRTLVARLKIEPGADLAKIEDYWGLNDRNRGNRPMIESLTESGASIDLVHLLPPQPRKLLYTYPPIDLAIQGRMPDCHWTSLNFFNFSPQTYFLDTRLASSHVLQAYTAVAPPYQFGDVLFFLDSKNGNAFHSCAYVADDIVYTKNGENFLSPWVLTRLDDLKGVYLKDVPSRIQGYRLKPLDTASR